MALEMKNQYSFLPWLRRGLSNQIQEEDRLGAGEDASVFKRAQLSVVGHFKGSMPELVDTKFGKETVFPDKPKTSDLAEQIRIPLIGPGDIVGVNKQAILQVVPAPGLSNFESNYYAFIEFFEEDFPWRYTPAAPAGSSAGKRLRPWLALLVCKREEYSLQTTTDGAMVVSLKVANNTTYKAIFPDPRTTWASAHIQYTGHLAGGAKLSETLDSELTKNPDIAFSRLLSTRHMEDYCAYTAFLVPAFETGRLAGLGKEIDRIPAQRAAWEVSYEQQQNRGDNLSPFDFPVYHYWEFETSSGNFDALARKLTAIDTTGLPLDIVVDVQRMGNGFEYDRLVQKPARTQVKVPVATVPIAYTPDQPFPNPDPASDEAVIAQRLRELLDKNPVLLDNKFETIEGYEQSGDASGDSLDDPWVVPPLYGAKHIMATTLDSSQTESKYHPWFTELNLDVRHRSAAGLGKKVVQENQETFVHRAWEQVEQINTLNQMLREYLMNLQVNKSLYDTKFNSTYVGNLIMYLQPMKHVKVNDVSLKDILQKQGIPSAYASAAFQQISARKSIQRGINPIVTVQPGKTTVEGQPLMTRLAEENIYQWPVHSLVELISAEQIKTLLSDANIERICYLRATQTFNERNQGKNISDAQKGKDIGDMAATLIGNLKGKAAVILKVIEDNKGNLDTDAKKTTPGTQQAVENLFDDMNPRGDEAGIMAAIEEYYDELFGLPAGEQEGYWTKYIEELTHSQYPVMAYPVYPEPVYYYLKQLSNRFILPSVDEMPMDSMILLQNNPAFVEAFLCGMNTEMGKELLWREFPTDTRGSYFRKFWDTEDAGVDLITGYFDVKALHTWESEQSSDTCKLGTNHMPGKANLLVFAIKGELMKKYPGTLVYLRKAKMSGQQIVIDPSEDAPTIAPELSAWLTDTVYIVGFSGTLAEFVGNPQQGDAGYFLIFQERPGEPRFMNPVGKTFDQYALTINAMLHAGDVASDRLNMPTLFGKHVCQFLKEKV